MHPSIALWTGDTADEVGAEPARATDSESDQLQFGYPGNQYRLQYFHFMVKLM